MYYFDMNDFLVREQEAPYSTTTADDVRSLEVCDAIAHKAQRSFVKGTVVLCYDKQNGYVTGFDVTGQSAEEIVRRAEFVDAAQFAVVSLKQSGCMKPTMEENVLYQKLKAIGKGFLDFMTVDALSGRYFSVKVGA